MEIVYFGSDLHRQKRELMVRRGGWRIIYCCTFWMGMMFRKRGEKLACPLNWSDNGY